VRPPLRDVIGPILGSIAFFVLAPGYCAAVRRWWPRLRPWRG